MFMRELIYKDIYMIRKNLMITFGIFVGFFFIGLTVALSAKFGNLAKYVTDSEVLSDLMRISLYLSIIAGLMLVSGEEHIFGIIHKEYESRWHDYLIVSGMKPSGMVREKYLLIFSFFVINLALGIMGFCTMQAVSGIYSTDLFFPAFGRHEGILILIYGAVLLLITGDYFSLIEYIDKGRGSKKADFIKTFSVLFIAGIAVAAWILVGVEEDTWLMVTKTVESFNIGMLYIIPILAGVAVTVICYLVSVNIVEKEGRRV